MKKIFISTSSEDRVKSLQVMMEEIFHKNSINISIETSCSCSDDFEKIKKHHYDLCLIDSNECEHFLALFNMAEKQGDIIISLEPLGANNHGEIISIKRMDRKKYFAFDYDLYLTEQDAEQERVRLIIEFISCDLYFYFSYGNNKPHPESNEIGEAREVLLKVEEYLSNTLPNVKIKKDFEDFKKGSILDDHTRELASSPFIIMILNDEYLHSIHCMKEFYLILESVDFNIEKFNEKVFLIPSNVEFYLDSNHPKNISKFRELKKTWVSDLDDAYEAYKEDTSNISQKKRMINILYLLSKCIPFIRDELSKIVWGEKVSLPKLKSNGFPDLMYEVITKLEKQGFNTFYLGATNKAEKILNNSMGRF